MNKKNHRPRKPYSFINGEILGWIFYRPENRQNLIYVINVDLFELNLSWEVGAIG